MSTHNKKTANGKKESRGYKAMKRLNPKMATLAAAVSLALAGGQVVYAGCSAIPGNQAAPFLAGQVSPTNGFAEYVTDANGRSLELCLDPANCFITPVEPGNLLSEQIGFGSEAFWWLADARINVGGLSAIVVMAAEAAFLPDIAEGNQFPFTRLRIRLDVPAIGIYSVTHPYGTEEFIVTALTAGDEVRTSADIQFTPGPAGGSTQNQGCVAPWLEWDVNESAPPAGFIGDGGTPHTVTGSPIGNNFMEVSAVDFLGNPIDLDGAGNSTVRTNLFTVSGKLYDGALSTPLISGRTTYERDVSAATGQVDIFATSGKFASVTFSGGPNLPAGDILMNSDPGDIRVSDDVSSEFFSSTPLTPDASAVPAVVELNATDALSGPTRLLRLVTDQVTITTAEYNADDGILTVDATSSDSNLTPTLTIAEYNVTVPANIATSAPPASVNVTSSAGGTHQLKVTVVDNNVATQANNDNVITDEDVQFIIEVLANDVSATGIDPATLQIITSTINGQAINNGNGTITYIPGQDFNGSDSLTYIVTGINGLVSNEALVSITVNPVNDAPVAIDDVASTDSLTPVTINVLANDSDIDGDTLSVTAIDTTATIGSVTNDGTSLSYTPAPEFSGIDTFSYTVSDGNGGTATATVSVDVINLNSPPAAQNDTFTVAEDSAATLLDLIANDSDVNADALTITAITQPAAGTGTVVNNGTNVSFTPDLDFNGAASFSYTISDGNGGTANANVTVNITPVNDAPTALTDSASTDNVTPVIINVLDNDSDVDGDALSVTDINLIGTVGSVTNNGTSLTYTPAANFSGTDTFTYTVSDGNGGSATETVAVDVININDVPVAVNDAASTDNVTPISINVLGNDSDVDGDALTVTAASTPANGTVVINADNTVTYTAAANFSGTDSFTYTISDGNGGTASASATVTVSNVNDAPVAGDDAYTVAEDSAANLLSVLDNDSDADGDALSVTSVTLPAAGAGTVVNNGSSVSYTPAANFNGPATFSYIVSDGNGLTTTANVTVTVNAVNDAPVAVNDAASTDNVTPVSVNVLGNDSDIDGDALTVTAASTPANGTVVINADNTVTYTAAANFSGTDSFTYTISDGNGGTASASATVTVSNVNDAPVAGDDAYTVAEDSAANLLSVLDNDSDADGDALSVTAVTQPAAGAGTVVNNGSSVSYTPVANFNGNATFSYTISDGNGGTSTANVNVNVTPVNDNPVAVADNAATDNLTPVTINALANDSDADGDALTISATNLAGTAGSVTNNGNSLTYTPAAGFSGIDTLIYTVSDGNGGTASATVSVDVAAVASVVDLDIYNLKTSKGVKVGGNVSISLAVNLISAVGEPRPATIAGVDNTGVEIYRQTLNVDDASGGRPTTFRFPAYTATGSEGLITWTATVADDDPDLDVATRTTKVNAGGKKK